MTEIDKYEQALRDILVANHEEYIATIEERADKAAERGDVVNHRWHLDHVAALRAMPYPWQKGTT